MNKKHRLYMRALGWLMMFLLIAPFEAIPQGFGGTAPAKLTKEELAQMVVPIASRHANPPSQLGTS